MKTATMNALIETDSRRGAYDMTQTRAIIQHHSLGRILILQGFGGMDSLEGGSYRWKYGMCYKNSEIDTIESVFAESTESGFTEVDGLHSEEFSGKIINKIAESVGLR